MGILQARILEWVAMYSPGDLPNPVIEPRSPALQADSLLSELPGKPLVATTIPQTQEVQARATSAVETLFLVMASLF